VDSEFGFEFADSEFGSEFADSEIGSVFDESGLLRTASLGASEASAVVQTGDYAQKAWKK
jgi:hypothetical protein